jgi:hypothetical protein
MLIHEVPEGGAGFVDNHLYVRPIGARVAQRVPSYVKAIKEPDNTITLVGPMLFTIEGRNYNVFLIHGQWYRHEIAQSKAA